MLILYDAVGTLAESAGGSAFHDENLVKMIMTPLIAKWQQLNNQDTGLFPLLECLSAVAVASGKSFAPYVAPIYERCLFLIKHSYEEQRVKL